MKNVVVIMAGGKGERFWPMSRNTMPKQFLNLIEKDKSMIQLTVERVLPLVDIDDIYVVTNKNYRNIIFEQLPNIPKKNVLFEPVGKNTAPCIGFACAVIKKRYGDANVIVLSSDNMIENNRIFLENLKSALLCSEQNNIVTLGIVPNRVETGYGYIKLGEKSELGDIYKVDKFVEKPNYDVAKEYYESKMYLWNSGMFIFQNEIMYSSIKEYMPELFVSVNKIEESVDTVRFDSTVIDEFNKVDSISIDYGIMERAKNIFVVPCSAGWDDVGSWLSVSRLRETDSKGNVSEGENLLVECNGSTILNSESGKLIAAYGLDNYVVVNTDDVVLIIPKDKTPDIKNLISEVKIKKKEFL